MDRDIHTPLDDGLVRRGPRGSVSRLPSGSLRVRVDAGINPVTGRAPYLRETVPAGPTARKEAEACFQQVPLAPPSATTFGPTPGTGGRETNPAPSSASRPSMPLWSRPRMEPNQPAEVGQHSLPKTPKP